MADTKITALAAITTVAPANDLFAIVDVSDNSMAASGTTKNITTNQILGAGGTATLASATITGDLTVDTSTLKVDSANNRVGILTATPAQSLDIASGNLQVRTGGTVFSDTFSNYGAALAINAAGSLPIRLQIGGTTAYEITSANVHQWSNVGGVAGTAMTLNSTGLGVGGTAIGTKLEVVTSTSGSLGGTATVTNSAASAIGNAASFNFRTNTNFLLAGYFGARIEAVTPLANNNTDLVFYNYKGVTASGDENMRITSSGNVGIGVVPATAIANNRKLEIVGTINSAVVLGSNSSNAATRNWAVASSWNGYGDLVFLQSNALGCDPLASSAGTTRMMLDADGNLLLGTVTSPTGTKIGSISKLGSVCVEGSNAISVSTTPVALARIIGTGGLFFVSGFNTSGGAQGWWLVASIGGTAPTVIASGNNTGLTVAFTNVGGVINMNTVSGTLSVTSFAITNSL